jgi:hypothetical protein
MKSQFYKGISIPFIIFFILIGGCEKEDFALPVGFSLHFTIKNEAILNGSITIDEIGLGLSMIDIRGYREQGDDVFLTRKFENGENFIIIPGTKYPTESLDIPQGNYNPVVFSLIFKPDEDEDDLTDDLIDWLEDLKVGDDIEGLQESLGDIIEDYMDNLTPCILFRGKFTYNSSTKNIVVVVNDPLTFQIHGQNRKGGSEVILDKNYGNNGNLQFNPSYWFSVITPAMMNDAFIGLIDDQEYIFLSKYVNSQIYGAIFNRMEESTILTINE